MSTGSHPRLTFQLSALILSCSTSFQYSELHDNEKIKLLRFIQVTYILLSIPSVGAAQKILNFATYQRNKFSTLNRTNCCCIILVLANILHGATSFRICVLTSLYFPHFISQQTTHIHTHNYSAVSEATVFN